MGSEILHRIEIDIYSHSSPRRIHLKIYKTLLIVDCTIEGHLVSVVMESIHFICTLSGCILGRYLGHIDIWIEI